MSNIVATLAEVAEHFGVQPNAVARWRQQGCPGERGRYDLDEIEAWKRTRPKDHRSPSGSDKDLKEQLLEHKVRHEAARADIEERKNELQRGQYVETHLLENFVSQMNQQIRSDLLRVPVEMASGFPAEHREQIVQDMTDRLKLFLGGLAAWQRRVTKVPTAEPRGPGRPRTKPSEA